jgi:hypothetical protein
MTAGCADLGGATRGRLPENIGEVRTAVKIRKAS